MISQANSNKFQFRVNRWVALSLNGKLFGGNSTKKILLEVQPLLGMKPESPTREQS